MYAIIETGGKQIKVEAGQEIYVEKLGVEADEIVTFDKVLFVGGETLKLVAPIVEGANCYSESCKRRSRKRKLLFSNTKRRKTIVVNKVIVNHTLN